MSGISLHRRQVLAGLAATPLLPGLPGPAAAAAEGALAAALRDLGIAPETLRWGDGIALTAPLIAEDGAAVPVTVRLNDGPVRVVHLLAPANRRVLVASVTPGEAAGRLEFGLRIRLAKTQGVTVVAERADGRVVGAIAEVQVTVGGGCKT